MSDLSDDENFTDEGDKDSDFNIADYQDEVNSDNSFDGIPGSNKKENQYKNNVEQTEEDQNEKEYIGPVLPGGHRFDKKFVCIKYPGNVINPEKAIETLGGLAAISTTVNAPNRRLELRFRSDDGYCKPACGDRHAASGFLLRVRVKKKRVKNADGTIGETRTSTEIIEAIGVDCTQSNIDTNDRTQCTQNTNKDSNVYVRTDAHSEESKIEDTDGSLNELVNGLHNCSVNSNSDSIESPEKSGIDKQPRLLTDPNCNVVDTNVDRTIAEENKDEGNVTLTFDKNKYEDLSHDENYELPKLKVLGRIDTEFKFMNLCDFQYLPITPSMKNPKENECIYNAIYPVNVPPYSWLKNKVPYFLPPAAFSRMDNVQQYVPKTESNTMPENIIGKTRKRRAGFSNFVHFVTPEVPTKPPKGIETAMKVKFLQNFHLERVRKMFEQRPIWSKNALVYETKFTGEQLKILLPSVAYYFMTGPWRIMWVKLGYDPRKDPSGRKYQTLDYRLKAMHGLESTVKCKRNYSDYILPYKSAPISRPKTTVLTANLSQEQIQKKERHLNENVYIYREGIVPPSRQMFYQYCDVLTDEIQEMLAKLPDPPLGTKCHEKRGWLPSGFDDQCREIINKQVRSVLRKQMNVPEDHPTTLPRKRKYTRMKLNISKSKNKKLKKSHLLNPDSLSIHMEVIPEGSDNTKSEDDNDQNEPTTSKEA